MMDMEQRRKRLEAAYGPLAILGQGTSRRRVYPTPPTPPAPPPSPIRAKSPRSPRFPSLLVDGLIVFGLGFGCCLMCMAILGYFSRS